MPLTQRYHSLERRSTNHYLLPPFPRNRRIPLLLLSATQYQHNLLPTSSTTTLREGEEGGRRRFRRDFQTFLFHSSDLSSFTPSQDPSLSPRSSGFVSEDETLFHCRDESTG